MSIAHLDKKLISIKVILKKFQSLYRLQKVHKLKSLIHKNKFYYFYNIAETEDHFDRRKVCSEIISFIDIVYAKSKPTYLKLQCLNWFQF